MALLLLNYFQAGANVFLAEKNEHKLKQVADELHIPTNKISIIDIDNEETAQLADDKIHEQVERIDILINAGCRLDGRPRRN